MEMLNLNLSREDALKGALSSLELNDYGLFYVVLKKHAHFHFFRHLVADPERTYFEPLQQSFRYDLNDSQLLKTDIDGIVCYEFYFRFSLEGTLNEHDERGRHTKAQPFTLKGIARVHHFSNTYGLGHEDLVLFDEAQYRLLLDERDIRALRQDLGWSYLNNQTYDGQDGVSFFTGIWHKPLADPNDQARKEQLAEHTSLNYFHELESAFSSMVYAALQAKRLQPYVGSFKDHYYPYQGRKQYYIEHNTFLSRHLEFLSYALAAIYTFWERLAFLSALHLAPGKLKTISFFSLYGKGLPDLRQRFPSIAQSAELAYLAGRCSGKHTDLAKYRHPMIHYQFDEAVLRGNRNADLFRLMLDNIQDEAELEKLYAAMANTMDFVAAEIAECKLGFLHTVNLVRKVQEPV
ncbi:hypothetical protein MTO98_23710 [Mucilaginibacter sp. SMC90]|uniref:hypothetical protein n=1 Tax=Mucilaginibacter sp. SMC90 TaxID=2929803 RepID=UPI001FB4793C|nr:hypothetical protein [Mucilaginibacter sp. SMC90]UOE47417.1 hypothetical protein MTO98_23710 [Mucilaginibacter sp. SMC90]